MDTLRSGQYLAGTLGRWLTVRGQYHKAVWGTPGGGSPPACAVQTTFSTTSAIYEVENPLPLGGGNVYIIPHFVKLLVTAADSTATDFHFSGVLDPKLRFSSGGFQPISPEFGPVNVLNMNQPGVMPAAAWHFGPVVLNAAGTNRLLMARGQIKHVAAAPLCSVGDEFLFTYTGGDGITSGSIVGAATTPARYRADLGFVCVPPQSSHALLAWFPAITAGFTFEMEAGWWEVMGDP